MLPASVWVAGFRALFCPVFLESVSRGYGRVARNPSFHLRHHFITDGTVRDPRLWTFGNFGRIVDDRQHCDGEPDLCGSTKLGRSGATFSESRDRHGQFFNFLILRVVD